VKLPERLQTFLDRCLSLELRLVLVLRKLFHQLLAGLVLGLGLLALALIL
jgi:hypothetical protein